MQMEMRMRMGGMLRMVVQAMQGVRGMVDEMGTTREDG